jgi:hypothetical protein
MQNLHHKPTVKNKMKNKKYQSEKLDNPIEKS